MLLNFTIWTLACAEFVRTDKKLNPVGPAPRLKARSSWVRLYVYYPIPKIHNADQLHFLLFFSLFWLLLLVVLLLLSFTKIIRALYWSLTVAAYQRNPSLSALCTAQVSLSHSLFFLSSSLLNTFLGFIDPSFFFIFAIISVQSPARCRKSPSFPRSPAFCTRSA